MSLSEGRVLQPSAQLKDVRYEIRGQLARRFSRSVRLDPGRLHQQSGRVDGAVEACVNELLAIPPAPLAMTRAMTAALGRGHPAMATAWADSDLQMWSFTEDEYREAARAYAQRLK